MCFGDKESIGECGGSTFLGFFLGFQLLEKGRDVSCRDPGLVVADGERNAFFQFGQFHGNGFLGGFRVAGDLFNCEFDESTEGAREQVSISLK